METRLAKVIPPTNPKRRNSKSVGIRIVKKISETAVGKMLDQRLRGLV